MAKDILRYLVSANHNVLANYLQSQLVIGDGPFIKNDEIAIDAVYTAPNYSRVSSLFTRHTFDFVCFEKSRFEKRKEDQHWVEYILSGKDIIGHLELIDTSDDRSVMFFEISSDQFLQALSKIQDLVSAIWPVTYLGKESRTESSITDFANASTVDTIRGDSQGSINEEDIKDEIVHSEGIQPNSIDEGLRLWQKYAIEQWNKGMPIKEISNGISKKHLGHAVPRTIYNFFSRCRQEHPEIKIQYRRSKLLTKVIKK